MIYKLDIQTNLSNLAPFRKPLSPVAIVLNWTERKPFVKLFFLLLKNLNVCYKASYFTIILIFGRAGKM